uniref:HMG box domain-containing protein n=1 Tax=Panagrolaimus sp. JU765 TaxID=591449 RepID=A0AC34RLA3_9BILA
MLEMVGKVKFSNQQLVDMVAKFCKDYGAKTESENDEKKHFTYMIRFNNQEHANAAFEERMESVIEYRELAEEWRTAQNNLREDAENDGHVKILSQIFYTGYTNDLDKRGPEHYYKVFEKSWLLKVDPKIAFISRSLSSCIVDNTLQIVDEINNGLTIYTVLDGLTKLQAETAELLINIVLNNYVMCSEATRSQSIYSIDNIDDDFRNRALTLGAYLVLNAIHKGGELNSIPRTSYDNWKKDMVDVSDKPKKKLKNVLCEKMMSRCFDAKIKTHDSPPTSSLENKSVKDFSAFLEENWKDLSDEQKGEIITRFEKLKIADNSELPENKKN